MANQRDRESAAYGATDERVREDVADLLARHPGIEVGDIDLMVADGVVTLAGTVDEANTSRTVEDAIGKVAGVKAVNNRLRVSQGRLNEVLNDFSASGTGTGRGTTGAAGDVDPAAGGSDRGRKR
jgi:hypothetical protein